MRKVKVKVKTLSFYAKNDIRFYPANLLEFRDLSKLTAQDELEIFVEEKN